MRISDWSSDVCSSDLRLPVAVDQGEAGLRLLAVGRYAAPLEVPLELLGDARLGFDLVALAAERGDEAGQADVAQPAVIGSNLRKQDALARAAVDPVAHLRRHVRKHLGLQR